VVAHTAAYYGYDAEKAAEALFALGVLGVGTATQAGKTAAYIELNKVVQNLARNTTWEVLDKSVVTKVINQVYARLGMTITKEKLGQAVPVLGIALGAGLNARLIARVADNAEWLYRERFLAEKYGSQIETPTSDLDDEPGGVVSIQAIVNAEVADVGGPDGRTELAKTEGRLLSKLMGEPTPHEVDINFDVGVHLLSCRVRSPTRRPAPTTTDARDAAWRGPRGRPVSCRAGASSAEAKGEEQQGAGTAAEVGRIATRSECRNGASLAARLRRPVRGPP
jgi:hypothetical protein